MIGANCDHEFTDLGECRWCGGYSAAYDMSLRDEPESGEEDPPMGGFGDHDRSPDSSEIPW